ncbi:hypothetical protein TNCV_4196541 [Trichonephila clavipes]|nr:hypothetical protein TNCV_4196541 [Trichonephila clavipes]
MDMVDAWSPAEDSDLKVWVSGTGVTQVGALVDGRPRITHRVKAMLLNSPRRNFATGPTEDLLRHWA